MLSLSSPASDVLKMFSSLKTVGVLLHSINTHLIRAMTYFFMYSDHGHVLNGLSLRAEGYRVRNKMENIHKKGERALFKMIYL